MAVAPITPSGLNTQVSGPIVTGSGATQTTQYNITGGTRPGGGANLFHSFGDFNVPNNNIANFLNSGSVDLAGHPLAAGMPTANILGRVTGGNISNIFGMIQTNGPGGFPNANLFLMNPAGFLFGPNATINVGGMVSFTSADYLKLADGARFNAIPNANADALLSAFPVVAFGFLGSNPGAITVQGSQLTTTPPTPDMPKQSLSFVGGNITIQSGTLGNGTVQPAVLTAQGGQINLASVASPGEVLAGTLGYAPNVNGQSFGALGAINISQQSHIDASGNGGGTVLIRGGQFVLDNSTISANVMGPGPVINGAESIGGGIDIQMSQNAVIQNGAVVESNILGNATPGVTYGGIHVKADRIEIVGSQDMVNLPFTGIRSDIAQGSTGGNSGNISLEANSLHMQDLGTFSTIIESVTQGAGNANNITIQTTGNVDIDGGALGTAASGTTAQSITGNAGNINVTSTHGNVSVSNFGNIASQSVSTSGTVGTITVNAPDGNIVMTDSSIGTLADVRAIPTGGSGGVLINTNNMQLTGSDIGIVNLGALSPGNITVNLSGSLSLRGSLSIPSSIHALSQGPGASAGLTVAAHDIVITDGSSLTTSTLTSGAAGSLNISAATIQMTNGGQISSASRQGRDPNTGLFAGPPPSGPGGTVTIHGLAGPAQSVLIDGVGSGIFTNAQGTGAGGNTNITAQSLTIQNGGTISAATSGTAPSAVGGSITVNATSGVAINSGGSITASSTGPADAGNIVINAGPQLVMQNGSVKTEAAQAGGGNIQIRAGNLVQLNNSSINTSVLGGGGSGGNISIDPNTVLLQNSQILAQAVQGTGGNIAITTNLLLSDANSTISASSQFGQNGTVVVQSPIAPASGKILPLTQHILIPASLMTQRCAALAGGQFSSFTVAGRNTVPAEPAGWLSAPLALATTSLGEGQGLEARGESLSGLFGLSRLSRSSEYRYPTNPTDQKDQIDKTDQIDHLLSLRQIAPPGFLTQSFAGDQSAGCRTMEKG
jgi:filamentous hemagglutinin family protein